MNLIFCDFVRQSIATITIYLIVLLQFKLSLVTQQIPPTLQASIAAQQASVAAQQASIAAQQLL